MLCKWGRAATGFGTLARLWVCVRCGGGGMIVDATVARSLSKEGFSGGPDDKRCLPT